MIKKIIITGNKKKVVEGNAVIKFKHNTKKKKRCSVETLVNKRDGSFGIFIDTKNKKRLRKVLDAIYENDLTIAGDGSNRMKRGALNIFKDQVYTSDMLVFGKSKRFDVELIDFDDTIDNYSRLRPTYRLSEDLDTILDAIEEFAQVEFEKTTKRRKSSCTCRRKKQKKQYEERLVVSSNYLRVGANFIDKNASDSVEITSYGNTVVEVPGYHWESEYYTD